MYWSNIDHQLFFQGEVLGDVKPFCSSGLNLRLLCYARNRSCRKPTFLPKIQLQQNHPAFCSSELSPVPKRWRRWLLIYQVSARPSSAAGAGCLCKARQVPRAKPEHIQLSAQVPTSTGVMEISDLVIRLKGCTWRDERAGAAMVCKLYFEENLFYGM